MSFPGFARKHPHYINKPSQQKSSTDTGYVVQEWSTTLVLPEKVGPCKEASVIYVAVSGPEQGVVTGFHGVVECTRKTSEGDTKRSVAVSSTGELPIIDLRQVASITGENQVPEVVGRAVLTLHSRYNCGNCPKNPASAKKSE